MEKLEPERLGIWIAGKEGGIMFGFILIVYIQFLCRYSSRPFGMGGRQGR